MDYSVDVELTGNAVKVFDAIVKNIPAWWGRMEGDCAKVGDEFTMFFDEETRWKFRVLEHRAPACLVWECIEAHHIVSGNAEMREDWFGTVLYWRIVEQGERCVLSFTHKGLSPELKCFTICERGWNFFLTQSLKSLIETGVGKPNLK